MSKGKLTNYDIMHYLVTDGGHYTCAEHLKLLQTAFPKQGMDTAWIRILRGAMKESRHIVIDVVRQRRSEQAIKVISVDKRYGNYSRNRRPGKVNNAAPKTWLEGEPLEVVQWVRLGMEFDRLLASHQNGVR